MNCLNKGHAASGFKVNLKCFVCHRKYIFLLHRKVETRENVPSQGRASAFSSANSPIHANHNVTCDNQKLLATALVQVQFQNRTCDLVAILDQGSEASFIFEFAVQKLKLNRRVANVEIECIFGASGLSCHTVTCQLSSPRPGKEFQQERKSQRTYYKALPAIVQIAFQ